MKKRDHGAIKQSRRLSDVRLIDAAKMCGISYETYWRREQDENMFRLHEIYDLANILTPDARKFLADKISKKILRLK